MRKHRLVLVHLLLFALVVPSLYDIARQREHWPFSHYPMFSGVRQEPYTEQLRLYGLPAGGGEIALPAAYLQPFDPARLHMAFRKMMRRPDAPAFLQRALQDCLARYEARRLAGHHDGPALRGLRLYQLRWRLEADAGNRDRPEHRRLVAEVAGRGGPP